jgi:hypothetical protein
MFDDNRKIDRIIRQSYDYKVMYDRLMSIYKSKEKMKESEEYKETMADLRKRAKWISYLV